MQIATPLIFLPYRLLIANSLASARPTDDDEFENLKRTAPISFVMRFSCVICPFIWLARYKVRREMLIYVNLNSLALEINIQDYKLK